MMLIGRISKAEGQWWLAECDAIGGITQGKSRKDACVMLADLIQVMARDELERIGLEVTVTEAAPLGSNAFEVLVTSNDPAALAALVLRHQRQNHGMSLADVAVKLGLSSRNAYARYEQGQSVPTIDKFLELLRAVAPEMTVIIGPRDRRAAMKKRAKPASSRRRKVA